MAVSRRQKKFDLVLSRSFYTFLSRSFSCFLSYCPSQLNAPFLRYLRQISSILQELSPSQYISSHSTYHTPTLPSQFLPPNHSYSSFSLSLSIHSSPSFPPQFPLSASSLQSTSLSPPLVFARQPIYLYYHLSLRLPLSQFIPLSQIIFLSPTLLHC